MSRTIIADIEFTGNKTVMPMSHRVIHAAPRRAIKEVDHRRQGNRNQQEGNAMPSPARRQGRDRAFDFLLAVACFSAYPAAYKPVSAPRLFARFNYLAVGIGNAFIMRQRLGKEPSRISPPCHFFRLLGV
jgi:hypothetical protein